MKAIIARSVMGTVAHPGTAPHTKHSKPGHFVLDCDFTCPAEQSESVIIRQGRISSAFERFKRQWPIAWPGYGWADSRLLPGLIPLFAAQARESSGARIQFCDMGVLQMQAASNNNRKDTL